MNLTQDVQPEVYFYLANGVPAKNIYELIAQLKKSKDDVYLYHVNSEKNDFANWIRDIYQDEFLANSISKAKNKKALIKELEATLKATEKIVNEQKKIKEKEEKKRQEELKRGVKIIDTPKNKSEILKLLRV